MRLNEDHRPGLAANLAAMLDNRDMDAPQSPSPAKGNRCAI